MTAVIALAISQIPNAAVAQPVERDLAKVEAAGSTPAGRSCNSARRGLAFYARRLGEWRVRMGAEVRRAIRVRGKGLDARLRSLSCAHMRLRVEHMRWRAWVARYRYERWHLYHFAWREWLPDRWRAIIACETFSNFRWNSGTYQGAFGFHRDSWDRFRLPGYPREAYLATPRQQYEVALAIHRRFGFSGWGCA